MASHMGTEARPYFWWDCACGFGDNRNTDHYCQGCGLKITCAEAGGHSWPAGEDLCEGGCGLSRGLPNAASEAPHEINGFGD